jgi:ribosomal protein S6--L-glutamate ligase
MKLALLCRNPDLYSHKRLVEAAEARGHDIDVIDHLRCYIDIASNDPEVHYEGESLKGYDAVIPRIGASVTFFGTAPVRNDGCLSGQRIRRDCPFARQAAVDAVALT